MNPKLMFLLLLFAQAVSYSSQAIQAPTGLTALAGDQSVILHWNRNSDANLAGYRLYRSTLGAGGPFQLVNASLLTTPGYCDLSGAVVNGRSNSYLLTAVDTNMVESSPSAVVVGALPHPFADDNEFLDYLQQASFDYFWYLANPTNGLIPDRTATGSPCSIAAEGFGLTSLCIGVDHGWITRTQAASRVLTSLSTFLNGPQGPGVSGVMGYKGWFYHFLDMNTGLRAGNAELSTIDTALLLAGVRYVRQYFDGPTLDEMSIRTMSDAIFNRVDWSFFSRGSNVLTMAWQPTTGFNGYTDWIGYNEAMILYCFGLGATNNPLPASAWNAWTSGYSWQTNYRQTYVAFPPLFVHEYSHCWMDFRHIADSYMNGHNCTYFDNSRRAALAQVAYCSTGPQPGYSSNVWGLTACDGPSPANYKARGLPPDGFDDGTIAPTAAGGAICFTPEYSVPALRSMYNLYRTNIWTENGFRDAFNPGQGWFDTDELGIDQGPIVIMIENYRTQRVWRCFMQNPEIQAGLERAGFTPLPWVAASLLAAPDVGGFKLFWGASANRFYQVEYSPDTFSWGASPGFIQAQNTGALYWLDNGPPVTASPPARTSQRFYRVFQVGSP